MKFQKNELIIPSILTVICWIVYPYPAIAMWTVFFLAAYSAIANDSIQTIGTFIASNSDKKWYYLWIYMEIAEEKIIKVLSDIVNRLDDLEIEQQKNKEMFFTIKKRLLDLNSFVNEPPLICARPLILHFFSASKTGLT